MNITSLRIKNFKRFTDLVIKDIPDTTKLVVIVGPNGSGKSSLFDALLHWYRLRVGFGWQGDEAYIRKNKTDGLAVEQMVDVTLAGNEQPQRGCVYVRTAYRNDPDFNIQGINRPAVPSEGIRIGRVIDNDQTVSENFQRLLYDTMAGVYDAGNDTKTVAVLREELIGEVRSSMRAVFGDLILNQIADPLGSGAFFFEKGAAKSYHYKNLSGGEKSAFDLLLDLHVKKKYLPNTVYCIDEMETHLHTKVQGTLLKELYRILPENSQLWITTHSLGVLRAALDLNTSSPGSVAVIDFDTVDPDVPHELTPSSLGRVSWEKMLSIALDDLSTRVAPDKVVVCEGSSVGNRRKDFDAEIYNRILGQTAHDVLFVSGGSSNQVAATGVSINHTLSKILPNSTITSLCDRDDKSDAEVNQFERGGGIVLSRRNLESFLFDDEVITALVSKEGKPELLADALALKQTAITNSVGRRNAPDDLKSPAGEIYVGLRALLQLTRCGNNTETFMRDTLAPLVNPDMQVFKDLKAGIIDRL